jgi:hypothetical protein
VSDLFIPTIGMPMPMRIAHRHMLVEIGDEAALFPEKEYISGIFVPVVRLQIRFTCCFWDDLVPTLQLTNTSQPISILFLPQREEFSPALWTEIRETAHAYLMYGINQRWRVISGRKSSLLGTQTDWEYRIT